MGITPGTKKLKLQYKATATEVAIQAGTFCKPDIGIHSAGIFCRHLFFQAGLSAAVEERRRENGGKNVDQTRAENKPTSFNEFFSVTQGFLT